MRTRRTGKRLFVTKRKGNIHWNQRSESHICITSVDARSKDHSKKLEQLRPSAAPGIFIYKTQISYISLLTHPVFITPSLSLPHTFLLSRMVFHSCVLIVYF